jgi:hypothetical protein
MDRVFFNADTLRSYTGGDTGRVIIFAFMRAAGIMLARLLEANPGADMSRIIIVSLPYGDNISRAGGPDEIAAFERAHPGQTVRAAVNFIALFV